MQNQGLDAVSAWVPYVMALCSVVLSSAGQVVLKIAVRGRTVGWHLLTEPVLYVGFLLYGLSAVVWLGVLSKLPLVVAYPLVSLNFILVAVGGAWILHERVSWVTAAGLAFIMAGIVLTARS